MSKIIIEVSARHCHLSLSDIETLFGQGYKLKVLKPLSQKNQFAAKETIDLKVGNGTIEKIRVLGPAREKTQVELNLSDAYKLKINPPVRLSGDLKNSIGGTIIGSKGVVKIKEGIIIAQRHIHCDPKTAQKLKIKDRQVVAVKTKGERSMVFNNVPVRIDKDFVWRMHIDIDEGNASLPSGVCNEGEIII